LNWGDISSKSKVVQGESSDDGIDASSSGVFRRLSVLLIGCCSDSGRLAGVFLEYEF
jgi:hypothetical protein